ncbi:MAG: hypothetical protein FJW38_23865 [Acidobacteria bacterium]|nr:hypothetical protein [Acidobacteriota bacterium]
MSIEDPILDEARERRQPPRVKRVPMRDRSREMQWVQDNRKAYADKWVAIEGDRLILADDDAMKVYNAAKAENIEIPFVVHMPPDDDLPFIGGW